MKRGILLLVVVLLAGCRADRSAILDLIGSGSGNPPLPGCETCHEDDEDYWENLLVIAQSATWTWDVSTFFGSNRFVFGGQNEIFGNFPQTNRAFASYEYGLNAPLSPLWSEDTIDPGEGYTPAIARDAQVYAYLQMYGDNPEVRTRLRIFSGNPRTECFAEFDHEGFSGGAFVEFLYAAVSDDGSLVAATSLAEGTPFSSGPSEVGIFDTNCQRVATVSIGNLPRDPQNLRLLKADDGRDFLYVEADDEVVVHDITNDQTLFREEARASGISRNGQILVTQLGPGFFTFRFFVLTGDEYLVNSTQMGWDAHAPCKAKVSDPGTRLLIDCHDIYSVYNLNPATGRAVPIPGSLRWKPEDDAHAVLSPDGNRLLVSLERVANAGDPYAIEVTGFDFDGNWGFLESFRGEVDVDRTIIRGHQFAPDGGSFVSHGNRYKIQRFDFSQ